MVDKPSLFVGSGARLGWGWQVPMVLSPPKEMLFSAVWWPCSAQLLGFRGLGLGFGHQELWGGRVGPALVQPQGMEHDYHGQSSVAVCSGCFWWVLQPHNR